MLAGPTCLLLLDVVLPVSTRLRANVPQQPSRQEGIALYSAVAVEWILLACLPYADFAFSVVSGYQCAEFTFLVTTLAMPPCK